MEEDLTKLFSLENKVAIITGGSGALGKIIAKAFVAFGAKVILIGRNKEKLESAIKEIGSENVSFEIADVTQEKSLEKVAAQIYDKYGRIDILVNAHGINLRIPTEEYPTEKWEEVVKTNLEGTFISCKVFGRYMIRQRSGKIINISSTAGKSGYEFGYAAYSPSKAGIDALTRVLAVEWAKYNIQVNAIAPYFILTPLTENFLKNEEIRNKIISEIPLKRLGKPIDIVGAVILLASKASDWITGQIIYIDGGFTAH
jgi:gluconate 5-dehydrogenase